MKYQIIAKGTLSYVTIAAIVIFSSVKYHVFGRKLTWYFIGCYIINIIILPSPYIVIYIGIQ